MSYFQEWETWPKVETPQLLQIPVLIGKVKAPIQSVTGRFGMVEFQEGLKELKQGINRIKLPTAAEMEELVTILLQKHITESCKVLVTRVEAFYEARLKALNYEPSQFDRLYQVVEVDWTLYKPTPGNSVVVYEVFTKRDIRIRTEDDT